MLLMTHSRAPSSDTRHFIFCCDMMTRVVYFSATFQYKTRQCRKIAAWVKHCNIPLCIAFVDYEKAFDSVQTQAILTSLQEQGIEDVYIEILKDIYTDSSVTVHLHKESEKIRIKRGVHGNIGEHI